MQSPIGVNPAAFGCVFYFYGVEAPHHLCDVVQFSVEDCRMRISSFLLSIQLVIESIQYFDWREVYVKLEKDDS